MLVDKGKYLVFSRQGEMPQIAIDTRSDIWALVYAENIKYKIRSL
jgi:predicted transcriptional regulator YdeE